MKRIWYRRLFTTDLKQLWVCADGGVSKFRGDVQMYKVRTAFIAEMMTQRCEHEFVEIDRQQRQGKALIDR
jgi:hypothetical protein